MIENYLSKRETLTSVVLIMDIRRTPKIDEFNFIDWLNQRNIPCIPILTKIDKLSKNKQIRQRSIIGKKLGMPSDELIGFSAKTRAGLTDVWQAIESFLNEGAA